MGRAYWVFGPIHFFIIYWYAVGMQRSNWKLFLGLVGSVLILVGVSTVSYAQNPALSKKVLRALRRQQAAGLISAEQLERFTNASATTTRITKATSDALYASQRNGLFPRTDISAPVPFKRLPWPPEQKIKELVRTEKNIFSELNKTQRIQQLSPYHQ